MGVALVCLLAACGSKNADTGVLGAYISQVKAPDNALHQTASANGVAYTIFHEPALFKFIKEHRSEVKEMSPGEIESDANNYTGIYLELSIEVQSHKLEWLKGAWQEGSVKQEADLILMLCGVDTVRPIGMHYVAGQQVQRKSIVNVVFNPCAVPPVTNKFLVRDLTQDERTYLTFEFNPIELEPYSQLNK